MRHAIHAAMILAVLLTAFGREAVPNGKTRAKRRAPRPPAAELTPGLRFMATATARGGRTAAGTHPHQGIVAADPHWLPLGSRFRIRNAGPYSGEYVVRDTGRKIKGRQLDFYLENRAEAKRFGKRPVLVDILSKGEGTPPIKPR